jgi:hypothetical protein
MEVVIKNNGSDSQKCVLFGYNDRCFNHKKTDGDLSFINLDTGDDISISIDGDNSDSNRLNFINSLIDNQYHYSCIEYFENTDIMNTFMYEYSCDANGYITLIKPIVLMSYVSAIQESRYPVKITDSLSMKIYWSTSFLFLLKPNQEIKLKFIK